MADTLSNQRLRELADALRTDRTIDIVTIGARSGRPRTTEIWFTNVGGRIIICGTPSAGGPRGPRKGRDWLANLIAHPEFEFHLKESVRGVLPARATRLVDPYDRRRVMNAPETVWYRRQGYSLDELVAWAPIVAVELLGPYASLSYRGAGQA